MKVEVDLALAGQSMLLQFKFIKLTEFLSHRCFFFFYRECPAFPELDLPEGIPSCKQVSRLSGLR